MTPISFDNSTHEFIVHCKRSEITTLKLKGIFDDVLRKNVGDMMAASYYLPLISIQPKITINIRQPEGQEDLIEIRGIAFRAGIPYDEGVSEPIQRKKKGRV